jgi:hypothetical protein
MKIYIAGPMTGYEDFNKPAFDYIESVLKAEGHAVLNPASLPLGLTEPEYMDICLAMVRSCECLFMLDGWEESQGATAEYHLGKKLGKMVIKGDVEAVTLESAMGNVYFREVQAVG